MNCAAGLVNITKLRQLDLSWTPERCSADLQLAGPVVSKVSEVYGDYSTVLADKGELGSSRGPLDSLASLVVSRGRKGLEATTPPSWPTRA